MRSLAPLAAAAFTAAASAQSLNVDFGAPVPAASYAGAGLAGRWNAVEAGPGTRVSLVALDGDPVAATVTRNGGTARRIDDLLTTGNDQRLFDDGLAGPVEVAFEDLADGRYRVTVYGWTPNAPKDATLVSVQGDPDGAALAGGPWPFKLDAGVTHAVHEVEVTGGMLVIAVSGALGAEPGFVNGIQLQRLTPADLDRDGMVDIADFLVLLEAWGDCQAGRACPADLDGNGTVDVSDLLLVLSGWD